MAFTYCENCGEKIDDTSKFCPHCGYSKYASNGEGYGNSQGNTEGNNSYGNTNPYSGQNPYGNQNPYGDQNSYGNRNQYGNQDPYGGFYQRKGEVNVKVLVFALVTLLCFSPLAGIIAVYFAMTAPNQPTEELREKKNKYSVIASVAGVVISFLFAALIFVYALITSLGGGAV